MMSDEGLDNDSLRRLLEVGRGLVSELELETLLDRVLRTAQELTGARYAALGILDDRRCELERFLTRGVDEETRRAIGDLPRGQGILGLLIEEPRALRLDDVGMHPRSYGFPAGHPPMSSFLGAPILIRGQAWGYLYLTEKEEGNFTEGNEEAVVLLAEWAAVAIDNARLYEREATRRDELERAVLALEASGAIARALGGETEVDRVLELIVKRGRTLVEARAMVLLLPEDGGLVVRAEAGEIMGTALGERVVLDRLSGRVLADTRPLRIDDVANHLQFSADELGIGGAQAALLVPLVYRAQVVGVLAAFDRLLDGPRFHGDDERLVLGFAGSAAAALSAVQNVERDRLRHSIEAAEKERRHWARELHDATLQGLGALSLGLSSARRAKDPDQLDRAVGEAIEQLADEIATLRALIIELRPAALDDLGVTPAVETLAERVRTRYGLAIEIEADLDYEGGRATSRPTTEIETTIYRTVQEALTNAAKHAQASAVRIAIAETRGAIRVVIADNGHGFDTLGATDGFGLIGMHERAALVGGKLEVESSPRGTNVRLVLPAEHRGGAPQLHQVVV